MKNIIFYFIVFSLFNFLGAMVEILAQDESIFLCGMELNIGMKKDLVIQKLEENYFLKYQYEEKMYTIFDSKEMGQILGVITFDLNDNLKFVSKDWFDENKSSCLDSWNILFGILSKYDDANKINVYTGELFEPNLQAKFINFQIGNRNIEVIINENSSMYINESLK